MNAVLGERIGMSILLGFFFSILWGAVCLASAVVPILIPGILQAFPLGHNAVTAVPELFQVAVVAIIWGLGTGWVIGGTQASVLQEEGVVGPKWKALTMVGWAAGAFIGVVAGYLGGGFSGMNTWAIGLIAQFISVSGSVFQALSLRKSPAHAVRWGLGGIVTGGIGLGFWTFASSWVARFASSPLWSDEQVLIMFVYAMAVLLTGALWGAAEGVRIAFGTGAIGQAIMRDES